MSVVLLAWTFIALLLLTLVIAEDVLDKVVSPADTQTTPWWRIFVLVLLDGAGWYWLLTYGG